MLSNLELWTSNMGTVIVVTYFGVYSQWFEVVLICNCSLYEPEVFGFVIHLKLGVISSSGVM